MAGVAPQHLVQCGHRAVELAKDAQQRALGTHYVVNDARALLRPVRKTQAILVELERFLEVVRLELLSGLHSDGVTLSNFCLSTLIFSKSYKGSSHAAVMVDKLWCDHK